LPPAPCVVWANREGERERERAQNEKEREISSINLFTEPTNKTDAAAVSREEIFDLSFFVARDAMAEYSICLFTLPPPADINIFREMTRAQKMV
jgi:hypothetical protein